MLYIDYYHIIDYNLFLMLTVIYLLKLTNISETE